MKKSAGILVYRIAQDGSAEFLLVHPGGPFWAKKDTGAWSVPKGEYSDDEDPLNAARREFFEETGVELSAGRFVPLSPIKQKSGKMVYVWACEQHIDAENITSNLFEMEWPPRSGIKRMFPEVDRAGWFDADTARNKIIPGQVGFIEECERMIKLR